VIHTQAKDQGQRSVCSKDIVKKGRIDGWRRLHYLPC